MTNLFSRLPFPLAISEPAGKHHVKSSDRARGASLALCQRMGFAENSLPEIRGRQEMQDLLRKTFSALDDERLVDVVQALRERVFAREPDDLLDTAIVNGVYECSFKPMVELLLRELLYLATTEALPFDERRQDMIAVMALAGF